MLTRGPMALVMEDMTTWRPGVRGQYLEFHSDTTVIMGEKEMH